MSIGVQAERVTVEYVRGGHVTRPLDGFNLDASPGSLVLLLGPSGCGKTTLLSCLAGILRPTSGRIDINGTVITDLKGKGLSDYRRTSVGIVFQAFNLVPSLDATENVMVPLRAAGVRRREALDRATELLGRVGLSDRLHNKPAQLSGGQQQRVGIARALAMDPALLLADEPTAALDHVQVETVLRILRGLADQGRTVVVSTHDPRMLGLADHVIDMVPLQAATAQNVDLQAGDVLFAQGTRGDRIYRVLDGEIDLVAVDADGAATRFAEFGPGGEFGEMGAVFDLPRSASAVARTSARVVGYTVTDFKAQFGAPHLMSLIARYAPNEPPLGATDEQ
jgi:putative ABC transport system ATP-binding protein